MIDTLIHCINIYVSNYYKPLLDIVYRKLLFRINISYTQILNHFQKKDCRLHRWFLNYIYIDKRFFGHNNGLKYLKTFRIELLLATTRDLYCGHFLAHIGQFKSKTTADFW